MDIAPPPSSSFSHCYNTFRVAKVNMSRPALDFGACDDDEAGGQGMGPGVGGFDNNNDAIGKGTAALTATGAEGMATEVELTMGTCGAMMASSTVSGALGEPPAELKVTLAKPPP
ncbi:hypothetical protein EW146_g7476 [Bondarzewia mesenterica]|uniref:Uncharacterized protein n=1 Tax=Bondarzewia mesenterica TaxID=1095465 RepID=A0A4S4LKT9_9AGAM|nr:hypothetical protein EW146_g7476 [Bondarzewia mesenterica]